MRAVYELPCFLCDRAVALTDSERHLWIKKRMDTSVHSLYSSSYDITTNKSVSKLSLMLFSVRISEQNLTFFTQCAPNRNSILCQKSGLCIKHHTKKKTKQYLVDKHPSKAC